MSLLAISIFVILVLCGCAAKGGATQASYPPVPAPTPSGKYTARGLELRNVTATFSGESLEIYSDYFDFVGKETYEYSIDYGGNSITMTNLATGQVATYDFKYSRETESVVIGGVQYSKQ